MAKPGERILVIDDDRTVLTYLKAVLGREGYRVYTALDAMQGPMVALEQPDLVVLDLAMPGGGCPAVLDRLRRPQRTMQVPVVVYSGLSKERAEQLLPADPDVLFVQKPGTPDDVLGAVRSLLSSH